MNNLYDLIFEYVPTCEQEEADKELILKYLSQFSDLLTRENQMAHFTASGWVTTADRRRFLMAYHRLYDSWAWLGGHADGEKDLCAAALREVKEESGIKNVRAVSEKPISIEILDVAPHQKHGKFVSAHIHLNLTFLFQADPDQAIFCKPDENSAVRWFTAQELEAEVSEPKMLPIYRKLIARANQNASTSF